MYDLLNTSVSKCVVRVIQIVPSDGQLGKWMTHPKLSPEAISGRNRATVLYTVWEREGIAPKTVKLLSRAGQVWVGCERSRKMLIDAGVPEKKLVRVPMPFAPDDPHLKLVGRARPPGVPRFLHVGKWEPRKGQQNIIGAFMLAFRPGDAELMLKTSKYAPKFSGYPSGPGAAIATWLEDPRVARNGWTAENVHPSIRMIRERLTEAQMVGLHKWSDIYVTLSHGEGFDMPAFDAKLSGNRMVYTESGGPEDFAGSGDVRVPTAGRSVCHPFYTWGLNARGTGYWLEDAAEALREATVGVSTREFKHDFDVDSFSAEHVGRGMLASLNAMAESFGEEPLA
jgi:glycosyltransferase involved in cell wall biosynthesis